MPVIFIYPDRVSPLESTEDTLYEYATRNRAVDIIDPSNDWTWVVTLEEPTTDYWKTRSTIIIATRFEPLSAKVAAYEMEAKTNPLRKECFVTIGATADFPQLLTAAVSDGTLTILKSLNYTDLTLQVGKSETYFHQIKPEDDKGINIKYFAFKSKGLENELKRCKAKEGVSDEGLVVCHAGSGTILDAMRLALSIVVVPNDSLLDNHQEELAAELEKQGYVVKADVKGLAKAIENATKMAKRSWGGGADNNGGGFAAIVDSVCGYKEEEVKGQLD